MPKKKRPATSCYPDKILPFSGDPSKIGAPTPHRVNEYFLIEALLRSEKVKEAYRQGGEEALIAKFRECGVIGHSPLHGSHHALLLEPGVDKEWEKKLAQLGYADIGLGILDLGVRVKLLPNKNVYHGNLMLCGPNDGVAECLAYLRDSSPRFLCLRIDASRPIEIILKRLRRLLRGRHEQAKLIPLGIGFYDRLKKTPFRNIEAWIRYLQCYDLFQSGKTMEAAGKQVYSGSPIAAEHANVAIKRVNVLIEHAEATAREQAKEKKKRIKKLIQQKAPWPPHKIP